VVITVDDAFFHDEEDVFSLADILQGIAGDRDNIGEFTGFEGADFVGQAQEIGIRGSSRLKRINGLHTKVHHLVKLFGVSPVGINGGVGAKSNLDAFGEGALKGGVDGVGSGVGFGGDGWGHVNATIKHFLEPLNGHEGGHEVGAALLHHVESLVVEEAAVFDGIDASSNGAFGGFRAVGMSSGFAAQGMGFVNDGVEFFLGELRRIHIIGGRKNAAGGADLDHVRAVLVVKADGIASFIRAVNHPFQRARLVAEKALAKTILKIAVATRSTQGMHRDKHAWSRHNTITNGIAQANIEIIAGTDVANGSEAGH